MKEIPLTQGKAALVDDEDYKRVSAYSWFVGVFMGRCQVYRIKIISKNKSSSKPRKRESEKLSRFVLGVDKSEPVDVRFINKNPLDCRKCNLQICTHQQNSFSCVKQKNRSSKYKGVSWAKWAKSWKIRIVKNGKCINIGYSKNEKEAGLIYDRKAKEIFGEYAYLNERLV